MAEPKSVETSDVERNAAAILDDLEFIRRKSQCDRESRVPGAVLGFRSKPACRVRRNRIAPSTRVVNDVQNNARSLDVSRQDFKKQSFCRSRLDAIKI
jgi:hypothetical protein